MLRAFFIFIMKNAYICREENNKTKDYDCNTIENKN